MTVLLIATARPPALVGMLAHQRVDRNARLRVVLRSGPGRRRLAEIDSLGVALGVPLVPVLARPSAVELLTVLLSPSRDEEGSKTADVVVVIGAGLIGQAIARRVSPGKRVILADLRPENVAAAEVFGDAGFEASPAGMFRRATRSARWSRTPFRSARSPR